MVKTPSKCRIRAGFRLHTRSTVMILIRRLRIVFLIPDLFKLQTKKKLRMGPTMKLKQRGNLIAAPFLRKAGIV